jgi:UrcA family protein
MNSYARTDGRILALVGSVVVAVSAFLVAHTAAAALHEEQVPMAVVKFHDLDVNTPAGAAALYWRIHQAANRVCNLDDDPIMQSAGRKICAQDAEARAIGQLNFSRLTAYYQAKTGKTPPARISMAK